MLTPDTKFEHALRFSRFDTDDLLSPCSAHPIELEDKNWLTAEHYLSSKILRSASKQATVEKMSDPLLASKYAHAWYRGKTPDWKSNRRVLMTRALYTKVQMYDEVRDYLLATGEQLIVETSLYDYYWGLGRDQRGDNQLGKIWMDIRDKLKAG